MIDKIGIKVDIYYIKHNFKFIFLIFWFLILFNFIKIILFVNFIRLYKI